MIWSASQHLSGLAFLLKKPLKSFVRPAVGIQALALLFCLCASSGLFSPCASAQSTDDALLTGWRNAQTNIQTWEADFVQTRTLKSLTHPLTATGHVWFAAPNRFHWELGHPPQTIAVRDADQ